MGPTACDAARGVVTAGLVGSGDQARDEALKALQEEVRQLRSREPAVVLDDGAAAKEIAQLKAEVAALRKPSVEVGAELLGKYAGDGNWYDVIVEAVSTDSARVRFRDYGNSEDVALSDLRAKGDDRDAVIAQLRADLAAQPRSSEDALRDTSLASLRAELASYKDAERARFVARGDRRVASGGDPSVERGRESGRRAARRAPRGRQRPTRPRSSARRRPTPPVCLARRRPTTAKWPN